MHHSSQNVSFEPNREEDRTLGSVELSRVILYLYFLYMGVFCLSFLFFSDFNGIMIKQERMDNMLQQERHNQIIAKLNLEGQVRVKDLSKDFDVTEDCIRKDLTILEKANKLKRIHGGAIQIRTNLHAINVKDRKEIRVEEKKMIAQKAIELIKPGTTVFLGVSTITLEIAKLIYQRNLKVIVVTNMIDIMKIFTQDCATQLFFIGGAMNNAKDGFIGSFTTEQIKKFKFDVSFIGVVGIDIHEGKVTTYYVEDGITKKEVINSSKKCYMVAESAKFELDGNYVFADLGDFTGYIGEKELDNEANNKMSQYGLEII